MFLILKKEEQGFGWLVLFGMQTMVGSCILKYRPCRHPLLVLKTFFSLTLTWWLDSGDRVFSQPLPSGSSKTWPFLSEQSIVINTAIRNIAGLLNKDLRVLFVFIRICFIFLSVTLHQNLINIQNQSDSQIFSFSLDESSD